MTSAREPAADLRNRRGGRKTALCALALTALVAIFFATVVFQGKVFYYRDFGLFFYPKRALVAESVRRFEVPLWESLSSAGVPVLGAYQSAVFYPPALMYYIGPMPYSFMLFVVAHVAWAGLGTYYMMRAFGARKLAAWSGALLWTFAPTFISIVDNVSFITALAWLPWCLGSGKKLLAGGGWKSLAGLTLSFAMALLAGAPEPALFTGAGMAVLVAAELIQAARSGRSRTAARRAALLAAGLATATLIAGVELVPFVNHLRNSERAARLPLEHASLWPMEGADAARWVLPRFQLYPKRGGIYWPAQGWLKSVYLGAAAAVLALWTGVFLRRRRNAVFVVIAVIFAILSFGGHSTLWRFMYEHAPGFGQVRFPVKFFMPAAFAVCALAGFAIGDIEALSRGRTRILRRLFLLLAGAGIVCLMAAAALDLWPQYGQEHVLAPGPVGAEDQSDAQKSIQYDSSVWSLARTGVVFVGVALGLSAWKLRLPGMKVSAGAVALVAFTVLDAALISRELNPTAEKSVYERPPEHLGVVERGCGAGRVLATRGLEQILNNTRVTGFGCLREIAGFLMTSRGAESLPGDEVLAWASRASGVAFADMRAANEYLFENDNTRLAEYAQYEAYKEGFAPSTNLMCGVPVANPGEVLTVRWDAALWDRLRSEGDASSGRLERLYAVSTVAGWQGTGFAMNYTRPASPVARAILVKRVTVVADDAAAIERVCAADFDPRQYAVILREDAGKAGVPEARVDEPVEIGAATAADEGGGRVVWVSDTGNGQTLETECPTEALLYVADSFYPSIAARVDGRDAEVIRANYAFRAVSLGQGRHRVEFYFRPTDLYVGVMVTGLGVAALVAGCLALRRRVNGSFGAGSPSR